jgi:hypothetical protein
MSKSTELTSCKLAHLSIQEELSSMTCSQDAELSSNTNVLMPSLVQFNVLHTENAMDRTPRPC